MLSSLLVAIALGKPPAVDAKPAMASVRRFEQNAGQWAGDVRFAARTPHGTLVLGAADARLQLRGDDGRTAAVGLRWNAAARTIDGMERLPGVSNYLVGSDRSRWESGVAGFRRVRYADVAPDVDLEFYGAADGFEYDVVVRPGGDPGALSLRLDGVSAARVDADGSVVLESAAGRFRQHRPIAFQQRGSVRDPVDVRYELHDGRLRFVTGRYDLSRPLVIDPTFDFSTYLGGDQGEWATAVKTDAAGNIYVAGQTGSQNFPVTSPHFRAGFDSDAFVAKFTPDGATLVYATFLGGSGFEDTTQLAVTADGSAYVAGRTESLNFPTTGAFQSANAGGHDGFVARLTPSGAALVFSTYLGGGDEDNLQGLAIDPAGNAYVTGGTDSSNFPLLNPFRATQGGSFVTKVTPSGALAYSTYYGDTGPKGPFSQRVTLHAIAVDASGAAYLAGETLGAAIPATAGAFQSSLGSGPDGVVAKLSPSGVPVYGTYLHGTPEPFGTGDAATGITVDGIGNAYVLGSTSNPDFPTTAGAERRNCPSADCWRSITFVTVLNPAGSGLVFSATLGGDARFGTSVITFANAIAVDSLGRTTVAGITSATDLPLVNAQQARNGSPTLFAVTNTGVDSTPLAPPRGTRANALAVATDGTLYLRASTTIEDGPLSKSTDGGATWTAVSSSVPGAGLTVDPANASVLYTSSARSIDGGVSWVDFPAQGAAPKVRPGASNVLFAVDTAGGVAKSVNSGATWTGSSTGITTAVKDIVISPSNPDVLYAWTSGVTQTTSTVYVSVNGGVSWTPRSFPRNNITALAVDPLQPSVVYATGRGAWKTVDGGVTWTVVYASSSTTLFSDGSSVIAPVSGTVYLLHPVVGDGIYRSNNAGATWTRVQAIYGKGMVFNQAAPDTIYVLAYDTSDVFLATLSPTGTLVYESYLGGNQIDWPYGLTLAPDGSIVVAGVTQSTNFPTANPFQPAIAGFSDAFVTKLRTSQVIFSVDTPADHATAFGPFMLGGWAIDRGSAADTGIDSVHIWAISSTGVPTFIAAAPTNAARSDVAALYGSQFANAGYNATVGGLAPGTYTLAVTPHSSVTNTFATSRLLTVTVAANGGLVKIEAPAPGSTTYGGSLLGGWAIDRAASTGTGISTVHVWAFPNPGSGQPPIFIGVGNYGAARSDVGAIYGSQFTNSGFSVPLPPLAPGPYLFVASPFSSVTNSFQAPATVLVTAGPSQPAGSLDVPANNSVVSSTFNLGGWAIDRSAPAGTGIDYVHVYAFQNGTPTFLGAATLGVPRSDIGAIFGSQFTNAGYSLTVTGLAPGTYDIYTFAHSTVTGTNIVRANRITVQ